MSPMSKQNEIDLKGYMVSLMCFTNVAFINLLPPKSGIEFIPIDFKAILDSKCVIIN